MAFSELGLSLSPTTDEAGAGIRFEYGDSYSGPVYIKWRGEREDWHESFEISVTFRYVLKGSGGGSDYSYWSDVYWSNVPKEQCNPHQTSGRSGYQFAFPLDTIGTSVGGKPALPGTSVKSALAPDGWDFANRKYDAINVEVHLKSNYYSGITDQYGNTQSPRLDNNNLWIGYFPHYELTGVSYDQSRLVVTYSAPGWTRWDDRYFFESIQQGGEELRSDQMFWSTVQQFGSLYVPTSAIRSLPEPGQPVYVRVHMNAAYRDIGMDFGFVEGTVSFVDTSRCDTPSLSVSSATSDALVIAVSDSGDMGVPFDAAVVSLSGYSGTGVTAVAGGTATFPLPPLGTPLTVQAYGYTDTATSDVASVSVPSIGGSDDRMRIQDADGGHGVDVLLNVSSSWSGKPSTNTVKFAGRDRETVGYGIGGSAVMTVECDVYDGYAGQTVGDFERLAWCGPCVLREPGGVRRTVAVEDVTTSWDTVRRVHHVSMSLREV